MAKLFRILFAAFVTICLSSCERITDKPSVTFPESSYLIPASGGKLIIPVRSTGIDDVRISYSDMSNWEVDSTTGDMVPAKGWIEIIKVLNNYQTTRDLAEWSSGIMVEVEPNSSNSERSALVFAKSFNVESSIKITQPASIVE